MIEAGITTTGGIQRLESSNNVQITNWQHLELTCNSGNEIALYIDSALDILTFKRLVWIR